MKFCDMFKKFNLVLTLYSNAYRRAMNIGSFFFRVLVQNYHPVRIGSILANNSEVTLTASIAKSESYDLHLSTLDRDIKLKGNTMDTPNGWGYLVIGSQYKG